MKIIISPTKNMVTKFLHDECISKPIFFKETLKLVNYLKKQDLASFEKIFNASDKIIENSMKLYANMDLQTNQLTPAIIAYNGLQYKYADISSMTIDDLEYANKTFLIISAFYGLLRPLDGIVSYRLDFTCKIDYDGYKSLYDFWGSSICDAIDDDLILNLASDEYFSVIKPYVNNKNVIDVKFYSKTAKGLVQKGTIAKMARGKMIKYIIKNRINEPEELKNFTDLGFNYSNDLSDNSSFIFIKNEA